MADAEFHEFVRRHHPNAKIVIHPPEDPKKRAFCKGDETREPLPYLDRNSNIVKECEVLLATPETKTKKQRSGTWSTIGKGQRSKKIVEIINP